MSNGGSEATTPAVSDAKRVTTAYRQRGHEIRLHDDERHAQHVTRDHRHLAAHPAPFDEPLEHLEATPFMLDDDVFRRKIGGHGQSTLPERMVGSQQTREPVLGDTALPETPR